MKALVEKGGQSHKPASPLSRLISVIAKTYYRWVVAGKEDSGVSVVDRYRRWFEYEMDSHLRTLGSLEAAPPRVRERPEYKKALALMAHIVAARQLWLHRLGASFEGPRDLFPRPPRLEDLVRSLEETESAWKVLLESWTDADLGRVFEYQSLEGPWFRNSVEDILTQLFGHSWYHRGQIAALLRSIGAEPAVTDFVFWSRHEIPGRG